MKRKFLIFAIYEGYDGVIPAHSVLYSDNFPTEKEAKEHMKKIAFPQLIGITGLIEVFEGHGW